MRLFILYVKLLKVSNIHRQNKFVELFYWFYSIAKSLRDIQLIIQPANKWIAYFHWWRWAQIVQSFLQININVLLLQFSRDLFYYNVELHLSLLLRCFESVINEHDCRISDICGYMQNWPRVVRKSRKNYFECVQFQILAKNKIAIVNHSNGD